MLQLLLLIFELIFSYLYLLWSSAIQANEHMLKNHSDKRLGMSQGKVNRKTIVLVGIYYKKRGQTVEYVMFSQSRRSTELFLCRRSFSEAVCPACPAIVTPLRDDGGSDCIEQLVFLYLP